MTWRIAVDPRLCISSGMCVASVPGRFAFGPDEHSQPISELIDEDEEVRDAAASCPVEAISLTDAETGSPVPLD